MTSPNPALVSQRAARRLPRAALLLLCAAYLVPGLVGRDPWRSADITALGTMASIARGTSAWTQPAIAGVPGDAALLPYWLGAAFIKALGSWLNPALAARIPFALLLALVLALAWYAAFHLAQTEAAQPVPFAFGGQADKPDYARAIADGALLALIASLGLLQLGHETTPELGQLAAATLYLYALAAAPFRGLKSRLAAAFALPAMSASGAPAMAVGMGLAGTLVCALSSYAGVRRFSFWVAASTLLAAIVATLLDAWSWRLLAPSDARDLWSVLRMPVWFTWPAWPLVLWTLWRWRRHFTNRHISVPLVVALTALVSSIAMHGSDRALMLGLPAFAVLAAFALPTLQRSTAAAIDWFSVFFFSSFGLFIWVVYVSLHTGVPAKPAANVLKLAPGFEPRFSLIPLVVAIAGTLAWVWLVRWRTARHREAIWKSMVLPAAGVALCWLLAMTLGLPLVDYARGMRPLVERVAKHVPRDACIAAPSLSRVMQAALELHGGYEVDGASLPSQSRCRYMLQMERVRSSPPAPAGWSLVARVRRPTDRDELTAIYRRVAAPSTRSAAPAAERAPPAAEPSLR